MEITRKKLIMNSEEYLKQRVQDQIDWYSKESQRNQGWYKWLKIIEILHIGLLLFFVISIILIN